MKTLFVMLLITALTGCGTVGGAISGAGTDLSRAGDWIKSR
jgi:predicted small secreted protein